MFLMGLGALLVLGGVLYMARTAIWRGSLSGPDFSRPVRDTTSDISSATSRRSSIASVRPFRAARLNHLCAAMAL